MSEKNNEPVKILSMEQWEEIAQSDKKVTVAVNTRGISMWPLLRSNGDSVRLVYPDRPLRIGDIVMFHRADGKEIAHRICWMDDTMLDTLGDNCTETDGKFLRSSVVGLVTHVCRRGRLIPMDTGFWRFYGRFMLWSNPVRMFIRDKLYRPLRRFIKNLFKGNV